MCRGRMKIFWLAEGRMFRQTVGLERALRQIAARRQILVLNVSQCGNLGWFAAIQRSTISKNSFASATISSASICAAVLSCHNMSTD
jgi:hypothetical protein